MSGHQSRINHQPVFLLTSTPWRENSLRLDVFSRDYGRIALLARSARTRGSELRGIIVPFIPFSASWYGKEALKTLHRAEWLGGWKQPQSRTLFSGLYVNELLIKLTASEDPNPTIYTATERVFQHICTNTHPTAALRRFEWELLHALGLSPNFNEDASGAAINPNKFYLIQPESPPFCLNHTEHTTSGIAVSGHIFQQIKKGQFNHAEDLEIASKLMKMLIGFHVPELKTRAVLKQLKQFQTQISA